MDSKVFNLDLLAEETLALSETFRTDFEEQDLLFSNNSFKEFVLDSSENPPAASLETQTHIEQECEQSPPREFSSMLEQMAVETMNFDPSMSEGFSDDFRLKNIKIDVEIDNFSDEIELDLESGIELELEALTFEKTVDLESIEVEVNGEQEVEKELIIEENYNLEDQVLVEETLNYTLFTEAFENENELDIEVELFDYDIEESTLEDVSSIDLISNTEFNNEIDLEADFNLETCGLIYRIDGGVSTFSAKGICVDNISESLLDLENEDHELWKSLKTKDRDVNSLYIFTTKTRALAEVISDELLNRRFPVKEEMVCNISDPGFSWWMEDNGEGFHIFFKSFGTDRAQRYTRLGPLGDSTIAQRRFSQAEGLLRSFFPINEFATSDKFFSISSVKEEHIIFQMFKDLFVSGINDTILEDFPDTTDGRTLYFYFQEISALREFWLDLESKIG